MHVSCRLAILQRCRTVTKEELQQLDRENLKFYDGTYEYLKEIGFEELA
jgi:hypothetical protein